MIVDPGLAPWATAKQLAYIESVNTLGSFRAAAKACGVNPDGVRASLRALEARAALQGYAPASGMTHVVPSPFVLKGTSTLYDADGTVKLQWHKTKLDGALQEEAIRTFITHLVEDARGLSPSIPRPERNYESLLATYVIGDPHFGLYAWKAESGEDFDLDIAERELCAAIDRLVDSAPAAATALLAELGDFFHADNESNQTARSGNALDVDTRWAKVMQVGLRAMIYAINRLLEKHQKVIVRIVKGNHDGHSSFALALALDAFYSNNARVRIDLSPAAHWFLKWGKTLLGITHGDTTKMPMLPGVMAADRPQEWGATVHRYWLCGHVHHAKKEEYPGVVIEYFRTLAPRDAWHSEQGYRAGRDMTCIVYDTTHGELERHRCDIGMI
jgi:hypothetical protein